MDGMISYGVGEVVVSCQEVTRMTYVVRRDNESNDSLIKRFRKKVSRDRILSELRRRRYYVTKGEEERIAKRKGISKARRRERKRRGRTNNW
jgi:small subunit ribosomal protein S21